MKKILLSLILSSLSLGESQAISTKNLSCKFHNSRKCVNPNHFKKELSAGCASVAGNCRYQFCKSNCIDLSKSKNLSEIENLCKSNCLDPRLLARFNEKTRAQFYEIYYPHSRLSTKEMADNTLEARSKEQVVHEIKKKQWWRFGRASKNTKLLQELVTRYARILNKLEKEEEPATIIAKTALEGASEMMALGDTSNLSRQESQDLKTSLANDILEEGKVNVKLKTTTKGITVIPRAPFIVEESTNSMSDNEETTSTFGEQLRQGREKLKKTPPQKAPVPFAPFAVETEDTSESTNSMSDNEETTSTFGEQLRQGREKLKKASPKKGPVVPLAPPTVETANTVPSNKNLFNEIKRGVKLRSVKQGDAKSKSLNQELEETLKRRRYGIVGKDK